MEKLYYKTPYIKTFEARVLSCAEEKGGFGVVLDQTGFYPEGGGQPSDTGTLGEASVLTVKERGGEIVHTTDRPLEKGELVTGVIDWEKRYDNMQHHSGEHLLSGLIHKRFGYDNVGFHMGKDEVTVDFNGVISLEEAGELEAEANKKIYENLPVLQLYPSKEELEKLSYRSKKELTGQVRIVEIPGGDVCACCGTHVERTGEIGILKITGLSAYKGGMRISMLCGRKALLDYGKRLGQVTAISVLLSAKPEAVEEAVDRLKRECAGKDMELGGLYRQLLEMKSDGYPASQKPLAVWEADLPPARIRQLCTLLYEKGKGGAVMVCSEKDGVCQYALGSARMDMRALSKELNGRLNGRGGGSALLAQGTFAAPAEKILEAFWQAQGEEGDPIWS